MVEAEKFDDFAHTEKVMEADFVMFALIQLVPQVKYDMPLTLEKTAPFNKALLLLPLMSFQEVPEPG